MNALCRYLAAALLVLGLAAPVAATTLKIATVAPDGTVWMKELRAAAKTIDEQTEGRVKFKFYPGGVMGDAATVRRKMRVGQLQGGAFTGGELAEVDPNFFLYSLPFLFDSEEQVRAVREDLDPPLVDSLREAGMELLGAAGGGFAYIMSDQPLRSEAQLAKTRVWVPDNDPLAEMALRRSGVSPIPLSLADVYTSLQTGAINTVMNTEVGAIAFQWHTKIKYVVDLPVAYVIGAVAVDNRAFRKISEPDQAIVKQVFARTFDDLEQLNVKDNAGAREALKNQGIEFIELSADEVERWNQVGVRTLDEMTADNRFKIEKLSFFRDLLAKHSTTSPTGTSGGE